MMANRMITGTVATRPAANRWPQSTEYSPMYWLIATVSGCCEVCSPRLSVSATRNSFQAEMKVKISAVTMPGAASGSVIRSRAPTLPSPSTMAASSSSTGIEVKKALRIHTAKAMLKPALMMMSDTVGEAQLKSLNSRCRPTSIAAGWNIWVASTSSRKAEAAAEAVPRGVVGGRQGDQQHQRGGAGRDFEAGADAAAQVAGRPTTRW